MVLYFECDVIFILYSVSVFRWTVNKSVKIEHYPKMDNGQQGGRVCG